MWKNYTYIDTYIYTYMYVFVCNEEYFWGNACRPCVCSQKAKRIWYCILYGSCCIWRAAVFLWGFCLFFLKIEHPAFLHRKVKRQQIVRFVKSWECFLFWKFANHGTYIIITTMAMSNILSSHVMHVCVYWEKLKNDKKALATLAVVILTVLVSAMQGRLREVFPWNHQVSSWPEYQNNCRKYLWASMSSSGGSTICHCWLKIKNNVELVWNQVLVLLYIHYNNLSQTNTLWRACVVSSSFLLKRK